MEQPVNLPSDPEPVVVYYPTCVLLRRCGGCCVSEILQCAPSREATQTVTVIRARYPHVNAASLEYDGEQDIEMDVHLACECRCRVQPYDCNNAIQDYAPDECRCKCRNENEATRCPVTKRWDETKCRCVCSKEHDCLPGEVFRAEICRCQSTTPAPPLRNVYDPCARKHCPPQFQPRKVSAYSCRCEFVTSFPRRSRSLGAVPKTRLHVEDRFPMMRAGVFDQR